MSKRKSSSHSPFQKLIWIPLLILVITFGALGARLFYLISTPANPSNKTEILVSIESKSSTHQIGHYLYSLGLIRSPYLFKQYCKFTKSDRLLQAGLFKINAAMPMKEIISVLEGKTGSRCFVRVTIPEGSSLRKIDAILAGAGLCTSNAFLDYANQAQKEFIPTHEILKKNTTFSLEGYLFPETYLFAKGVSLHTIADTMLTEFEKRVLPIWKASPEQPFSIHQILTLASIIEKEAQVPSEMVTISSVFRNRLKRNMKLASDPTVLFALGEPQKEIVTFKDLEVVSSYNTYKNEGLPPGPIARCCRFRL